MNKFKIIETGKAQLISFFDQHWYKLPEFVDPVPSVTTVIGDVIAKGYGYDKWLKDVGNEASIILREAGESGTKLHEAIEFLLKGGEVTAEEGLYDIYEWKKLNCFIAWLKSIEYTVLANEFTVYDMEWKVAGTVDCLMQIKNEKGEWETWLLDWKTGNNIYNTSHLQVAAYFAMNNKLNETKAVKAAIVHIGAQNKAGIKIEEVDTEENIRLFEHTIGMYYSLFPNKKAPTTEFPLKLKL